MDQTLTDERRERGLTTAREIAGDDLTDSYLARLNQLSPPLADALLANVYGDLHPRPGLSPRDRELLILATLIALGGCEDLLRLHVRLAINSGVEPNEILEMLLQATAYTGFPRALTAASAIQDVFAELQLLPVHK
ncbi:carboxymuconolactone decarboxylase family protein [Streptomyces sp. NPDC005122]